MQNQCSSEEVLLRPQKKKRHKIIPVRISSSKVLCWWCWLLKKTPNKSDQPQVIHQPARARKICEAPPGGKNCINKTKAKTKDHDKVPNHEFCFRTSSGMYYLPTSTYRLLPCTSSSAMSGRMLSIPHWVTLSTWLLLLDSLMPLLSFRHELTMSRDFLKCFVFVYVDDIDLIDF